MLDFKVWFDRRVRLQFHGAPAVSLQVERKVASDGGLVVVRESEEAFSEINGAWASRRMNRTKRGLQR